MKTKVNKLSVFSFGLFALILLCGYAGADYQDGYASPGDGLCGDCHTPQASSGSITIVGLPSVIEAGKTYDNLKVRLQRIDPTRIEGGFQMSVTDAFGSVGNLQINTANTDVDMHQSAHFGAPVQYLEQSAPNADPTFPNNGPNKDIIEWPFKWTAPSNTGSITFTLAGVLTNNDFTVGGDKSVSKTYPRTILPAISISTYGIDPVCAGGGGIAGVYEPTGGNGGPYFYSWSNGLHTQDISNLSAGSYTVTVSDVNNFTSTSTVIISSPPAINISGSVSPVSCNGGSNGGIDITINGALGSFSYTWSNGSTSQDLVSVPAGVYTVTVQDQNFCTSTKIFPVLEPSAIQANSSVHHIDCFGDSTGSVTVNPVGGKPPYTFNWSNNSTLQNQFNLPASNYYLTITDKNGCESVNFFTLLQGAPILLVDTIVDIVCSGPPLGVINLTASGGTGPFSYDWNNDGFETPDNDPQDLDSLSAGPYIVEVSDSLGCLLRDTFTVAQPPAFILSTLTTDLLCNGVSTGAINLSVSGGAGPFHYDWDNDGFETPDDDSQDLDSLGAGAYVVEVTDSSGCLQRDTFSIAQPPALTIDAAITNLLCNGAALGAINLTASGGTGPLAYDWDNDGFETPD
ncbi:MAG: SprB repeat-containing protein, partial [Saprospiraceae bacterium]|nr:SprB repeat-containing protein [Saprospiraceae bacterium]